MFKPFDFCLPSTSSTVPSGPDWLHEVKYDGYRLRLQRDGDRIRLITRGGYDWSARYPWIVESALRNRHRQFVIDGEAVVLGVDGVADFNALHSRKLDHEVQLYAFDILALAGDDLRRLPLSMRKTNLARLLARRPDGIFVREAPLFLWAVN
jgi:bifunctional non-homologous end joining protein LigD